MSELDVFDSLETAPFGRGASPVGLGVEYAHHFPACRIRQLKGCPMAARVQRGTTPAPCVTCTGMPAQDAATILKPLVLNSHSTRFTHDATCY